jgi:hypothetical protein
LPGRSSGTLRKRHADWAAVAVAVSLPWSTSATAVLIVLWLLLLLPTFDSSLLQWEYVRAAGVLPALLWLLAVCGMLWADVGWDERLLGVSGFSKLLMIPALLAQFYRSDGGRWVLLGFLASATALLLVSWCLVLLPGLPWRGRSLGVPVKDYLTQSGIFVICAFVLLHYALELRTRHRYLAMAAVIVAVMFVASVGYIATSRTSMAVFTVLLLLLGAWHFGCKGFFGALVVLSLIAALLWSSSSDFRSQILGTMEGAERGVTSQVVTSQVVTSNVSISTGFRLEVWTKSMQLIGQAPLIGHGTGTIAQLFRLDAQDLDAQDLDAQDLDAQDKAPSRAATPDNPHNQIFVVGIQLGLLGACLLIAMWIAHLLLFRNKGPLQWIGLVIVAQNIISSAFNSHLSDFTQGWLYVLGTGVVGGMVLRQGRSSCYCEAR